MVISVRLFVLYICLLLWVGVVHGEAIPETFRLVTVKFEGVHSIQKEKLAETLALKIHEKWKFWKPKPILNRSDLDEDLVRIKQFYQRNGYYHTNAVYKVDVSRPAGPGADSEKDESKDGALADLAVTYTVTEGPPVLIETIDIRVEKPVDGIDASRLEDSLPIQTGKIFVVDAYNTAKKELSKIYGNKGYSSVAGQRSPDGGNGHRLLYHVRQTFQITERSGIR